MPIIKDILFQVVLGIRYAHSLNILHRDLKPQNILVSELDSGINVKVGDWGLARPIKPRHLHSYLTHAVVTLWYRSPELLLGNYRYGSEVDVWSIGVVLLQMMAGAPLVQAPTAISCIYALFELFGTPHGDAYYESLPLFSHKFPRYPYRDPKEVFRRLLSERDDVDDDAINLLSGILNMAPDSRMTLKQVMWSPFLKEVRDRYLMSAEPSSVVTNPSQLI